MAVEAAAAQRGAAPAAASRARSELLPSPKLLRGF